MATKQFADLHDIVENKGSFSPLPPEQAKRPFS